MTRLPTGGFSSAFARRMRDARGQEVLVRGGPEAERAFAETQLLQKQLMANPQLDKLSAAQEQASRIASENIARQQAEREALRVDAERRARLALDQDAQREQATQDRARIQIDAADREQQNQLRLNEQNINRARYGAAAQLDSDKLQQSATQFAKNLALQEQQLEERQRASDFTQKKETDRIAEGLLKQMRGKKLTEEGQKKVAELSSIYRGIASNKNAMRGHQYDSMMQDWLDLAEEANIDQYAMQQQSVGDQFAGEFSIVPVTGEDGITRQYEVQRDADGNLKYERLEQQEGTPMYGSLQERKMAVANNKEAQEALIERAKENLQLRYGKENPDYMPSMQEMFREVENILREDQAYQDRFRGMATPPAPQATLGGGNLSLGRDANVAGGGAAGSGVGDMSALMRRMGGGSEPVSPSDGRTPQSYPSPQDATKLPTWGGSVRDYGSMGKFFKESGGGFYGTDRPGMKRLTDPSERSFFNAMKAHRTGPTKEHKATLNSIMLNDVEAFSSGKDMKDLNAAILESPNPFKFNPRQLLNDEILLKLVQSGAKDPLGNVAKGMAEAVRTGQGHYATHSTPSYHREINAPVIPRKAFENMTGEQLGKLPIIWMDEFGLLYQRDESSRPQREGKAMATQVGQGMFGSVPPSGN